MPGSGSRNQSIRAAGTKPALNALIYRCWIKSGLGLQPQLENAIERAVVLGETDQVRPEDLPESVTDAAPGGQPRFAR